MQARELFFRALAFEGAERLVRFHVQEVRHSKGVLPFRWSDVGYAPQLAHGIRKAAASSPWRKLKVGKGRR